MRVISDSDTLAGLPEGTNIQVSSGSLGTQTWVKSAEDLFARDGVVVPVAFFVGYVNQGLVAMRDDGDTYQVGDWFSYGSHDYCLVDSMLAGHTLAILDFYEGRFHEERPFDERWFRRNMSYLARMDRVPDRVLRQPDSGQMLVQRFTRLALVAQQREERKPDTEEVTVNVGVVGEVPTKAAGAAFGVRWQFTYSYSVRVPSGTCACDTLNTDKVKTTLPRPFQGEPWDATATCRND